MYQGFLGLLGQKIWILSAKRIWGSLDLEQKSSADNQAKRVCACISEQAQIALWWLTVSEYGVTHQKMKSFHQIEYEQQPYKSTASEETAIE